MEHLTLSPTRASNSKIYIYDSPGTLLKFHFITVQSPLICPTLSNERREKEARTNERRGGDTT